MSDFCCRQCNITKSAREFKAHSRRLGGHVDICIECSTNNRKNKDKKRYEKYGTRIYQKYKKSSKNAFLKRTYGISLETYDMMIKNQSGLCAICAKNKKLVVDHSHKTGTVRDLLCNGCNTVLGHFHENIDVLKSAIQYIRKWQGK